MSATPTRGQLHRAVYRVVEQLRREADGNQLPPTTSAEFLAAPFEVQVRALALAGATWTVPAVWGELPKPAFLVDRERPVTPMRCTWRGCRAVVSIQHPLPDLGELAKVRCDQHPWEGHR